MIYFKRNNGELGVISYGATPFDLEMIQTENRPELFEDIAKEVQPSKESSIFDRLPKDPGAYMVVIK